MEGNGVGTGGSPENAPSPSIGNDNKAGLHQQIIGVRNELLAEVRRVEELQQERHQQNVDRLDEIDHVLLGNGQPGFVKTVTDYIAESRGRDAAVKESLDRHNAKQNWKLNLFMALVAFLTLLVGALAFVVSVSARDKGLLTWPAVQHSELYQQLTAFNKPVQQSDKW
jgi:hypothetical protein